MHRYQNKNIIIHFTENVCVVMHAIKHFPTVVVMVMYDVTQYNTM